MTHSRSQEQVTPRAVRDTNCRPVKDHKQSTGCDTSLTSCTDKWLPVRCLSILSMSFDDMLWPAVKASQLSLRVDIYGRVVEFTNVDKINKII